MAEQILEKYKSRRNSACLVRRGEERLVVKTFAEEVSFQKELQIYRMLQNKYVPCAKVISAENKTLVLSQLPGKTLLECLEQQEQTGRPDWQIWEKLVAWLTAFQCHTGLVMTDVNLRNFIYDEENQMLYGLDFEECSPGSPVIPAAGVAAFVRTYAPVNTLGISIFLIIKVLFLNCLQDMIQAADR